MSLLIPTICEENRKPLFNEVMKVQESLGFKLRGFNPRIEKIASFIDIGESLGVSDLYGVHFSFAQSEKGEYEIRCDEPATREKLKYYNKMALIQDVDKFINANWITIDYLSLPKFTTQSKKMKTDFVDRCFNFLKSLVKSKLSSPANEPVIQAVAEYLYINMSKGNLLYHNPVHVMCILDFAKKNNIFINQIDELAIWFHDAVYWPQATGGKNELESAEFMKSCLNTMVNSHQLDVAYNRILATAKHLDATADGLDTTVLDLDLCSFSFDREIYTKVAGYIQKEFDYVPRTQFLEGRKKFLESLISKGFVYRSEAFQKFEAKAQENIRLDLAELKGY